jgi:hypothetical protein
LHSYLQVGASFSSSIVQQNGTFWGAYTVDYQGRAAIRWFHIDAVTNTLIQEGLIADDQLDFFLRLNRSKQGGRCRHRVQRSEQIAIRKQLCGRGQNNRRGHNVWCPGTSQGKRGRLPPGSDQSMGDYSATVVDPIDPLTFWTFQDIPYTDFTGAVSSTIQITQVHLHVAPQSIVPLSGTPQTTPVDNPFASALQVKVMDGLSNPILGEPVTFAAPFAGASARFAGQASWTVITNSAGIGDVAGAGGKPDCR